MMAVALASACFLLGSVAASALTNDYCGGVQIDEYKWCDDGSKRAYYYNRAQHSGGANVTVCERMLIANTTVVRQPAACGSDYVARDYGLSGCCYEPQVSHRNSGERRTVAGVARS